MARVLAVITTGLAIALLCIRPMYWSVYRAAHCIVLTPRYEPRMLDSLIAQYPEADFCHYDSIRTFAALSALHPATQYWVLGEGLSADDWQQAGSRAVYLGGVPPEGIVDVQTERIVEQNARWPLQVRLRAPIGAQYLKLKGPEGLSDSVMLSSEADWYSLQTRPVAQGKFLYELQMTDSSGAVLHSDRVDVQVKAARPVRVLVLAGAPSFEWNYLKNWLSASGHQAVFRMEPTRGRYLTSFVNLPETTLLFSEKELDSYDLLIAPAESFSASSANRQIAAGFLRRGAGLILLADEDSPQQFGWEPLRAFTLGQLSARETDARWPGYRVSLQAAAFIRSGPSVRALVQSGTGEALVAESWYGNGRVLLSTLLATYPLWLSGNTEAYESLWNLLLRKSIRQDASAWQQLNWPASEGEAISFRSLGRPVSFLKSQEGKTLYLRQDYLLPEYWLADTWAMEEGWQGLYAPADSSAVQVWYYVHRQSDWAALRSRQRMEYSARWQANVPLQAQEAWSIAEAGQWKQCLAPYGYLLLAIAALAFLWAEERLGF
jgi:hypothetical protein